jgi:hypothetical protein
MNRLAHWLGRRLADYLTRPVGHPSVTTNDATRLAAALRPADVLLVDGNTRLSVAIKYLTQSTWSHATLYVGARPEIPAIDGEPLVLIEADLAAGVRAIALSAYAHLHTRICRPVGLSEADRERVIRFAIERIGLRYDLRNVIDLARYLVRTPPVPAHYRRRLLALGSGDPTRAICSTLIAQAFQAVRYPILPEVTQEQLDDPVLGPRYREFLHIRHHSLYAPRDFDISPYFSVVKPTLEPGFDYRRLLWADGAPAPAPQPAVTPDRRH